MVYFAVVRPKEKETGQYYCQHKEELFSVAKKANEFVANNDPYLKTSLERRAQEYKRVKTTPTRFGTPYPPSFIEGMKPPYIRNKKTGKYELSHREEQFIKEDIDDTCNYDFTMTFDRAFKIPTLCKFNEGIGVHEKWGMLKCAQGWKQKIDQVLPDFSNFKVEISYEY